MSEGRRSPILLVEDEPVMRGLVIELLDSFGYRCVAVGSREEAQATVQGDTTFGCGLIDLGLPDGNGLALLPDLKKDCPWLVPIILTGDPRAETIVETMRAGAFDYLTKPFDTASLKVAVARALEHHDAIRERDRLFQLLSEEREQLKVRVEEATADIRQYAAQCEITNARLKSLLHMTQVSSDFYTDEALFRGFFEELDQYMPVQCVTLCAFATREFLAALRGSDERVTVIISDGNVSATSPELPPPEGAEKDAVVAWVERYTGLDTRNVAACVYPQSFWGRAMCTVGFFLPPEFEVDEACDEFLNMCAHFIASEWKEAQLLLHAVKESSLGDIALELSKGFIQNLTAIRTAADVAGENFAAMQRPSGEPASAEHPRVAPEAFEALQIVWDNVENLQRQIQEFRQLSTSRKDSIETVFLADYIDQAIEMLSMSVQSRGIVIEKDYQGRFECVLRNGTALARTFLDLISSAVRTVEAGGPILLKLSAQGSEFILFEVACHGMNQALFGLAPHAGVLDAAYAVRNHPKFLLAQRTVRSCGGRLSLEHREKSGCIFRIVLPQNALTTSQIPESTT